VTQSEQDANGLGSYLDGVHACRLEKLMRGEALPVEEDRVDLIVMWRISRGWDAGRVAA
jgi:hypothetical protein